MIGQPISRWRRLRWIAVPVLVLVAVGGWLAVGRNKLEVTDWATVKRGDLVLGIEVTGTLRATDSSQLGPPQLRDYWEYKIAHMAPEGEPVTEGTPVLAFDTSDLDQKLRLQMAEADEARKQIEKTEKTLSMSRRQDELRLAEAEGRLRKAELKVDLPEELAKSQELAAARMDLELAQREVEFLRKRLEAANRSAEAQLGALRSQQRRAEQRVTEIQHAIEDMVRKAPRDGTVIYVSNWRDEKKKVGDSCWRGEKAIELPDLTSMRGDGEVDEADAGKLREGQLVTFELDAHQDVRYKGKVSSIWRTVQRKSWRNPLKVVRLEIDLEETDTRRMRPGMRFRGKVETERLEQVLLVPSEAIFVTEAGPRVYRRTSFGHEAVAVELGQRNDREVEVLDGLDAGDRISLVDLGRGDA